MVGNLSNFTKLDIIRCLLRIRNPISRIKLSEILNLGEGTIRSILDILKDRNLMVSNKQGHALSKKGKIIAGKIKNSIIIKNVSLDDIFPDKKKVAIHIKKIKNTNIGKAYELRDTAVKNGADGALILGYNRQLEFYELDKSYTKPNFKEIENKFDLSKGDLVVVAYADSYRLAEHGALAAATGLNTTLKNIIKELK